MSDNQISGHLPDWLGDFRKLQTLDLSNNSISGPIPASLGRLAELVGLYLGGNFLEGVVSEEQFANFTKLKNLDLSQNQFILNLTSDWIPPFQLQGLLIGRIPSGNQFQTFTDSSIYAGNPDLCGFPLIQKCKDDGTNQDPNAIEEDEQNDNAINEEGFEMKWLNMSTGIGFAIGFWIVFGPLLFNKKWREAYFQLIDQAYDMVYVFLAMFFARFPLTQKCKDDGTNQDPNAVEEDEQNDNTIYEE
ncbi:putative Receptor-like protein EIX1 [Cocos nucifera]|uniref:Putative Receptor-like protein EIX1 n=1 Tax=Cocos nucifera TaxID=13894 RepID=A0A8K0IFT5_COCNU|nr:putative Receptor-like protein EIX1 [Cocos nucifera]